MKKLLVLSILLMLLSAATSAQGPRDRLRRNTIRDAVRSGELTRLERFVLYQNELRYNSMERRAYRDGVITPYERKKLRKMKMRNRREALRLTQNNRQQAI